MTGRVKWWNHAYLLTGLADNGTWSDAQTACRQKSAILASPKTPREWRHLQAFFHALPQYDDYDEFEGKARVFVGLRSADSHLPHM